MNIDTEERVAGVSGGGLMGTGVLGFSEVWCCEKWGTSKEVMLRDSKWRQFGITDITPICDISKLFGSEKCQQRIFAELLLRPHSPQLVLSKPQWWGG